MKTFINYKTQFTSTMQIQPDNDLSTQTRLPVLLLLLSLKSEHFVSSILSSNSKSFSRKHLCAVFCKHTSIKQLTNFFIFATPTQHQKCYSTVWIPLQILFNVPSHFEVRTHTIRIRHSIIIIPYQISILEDKIKS